MSMFPAQARAHESTDPLPCHLCGARMIRDGQVWTHDRTHDEGCFLAFQQLDDADDVARWNMIRVSATIGLGWDGIELLREAGKVFRRYETHHRRRAEATEVGAGRCVTANGREEFLRQAGETAAKAAANAEIAFRIEAYLATPAQFDQAEGPDDMSEAQRLIAALVDCGPHPLLIKRARRWLDRAEAGKLGENLLPLADLEPGERQALVDAIGNEAGLAINSGDDRMALAWSALDAIVSASGPVVGRCRICGCTDEMACNIPPPNGVQGYVACSWVDEDHTLCSKPSCVAAAGDGDDGCPKGDPECLGRNDGCHDQCESPSSWGNGAVLLVAGETVFSDLPPPHPPQVPLWTIEVNGVSYRTDQRHVRSKLGGCLVEAMWDGKTELHIKVGPFKPGPLPEYGSVRRRPLAEGLECVAGEATHDGLFPGDPGYDRDAAAAQRTPLPPSQDAE